MLDRYELFRDCRTTIPLSSLLCIPFTVAFVDFQMLKIGCVNYVRFPKSSHNYAIQCSVSYIAMGSHYDYGIFIFSTIY